MKALLRTLALALLMFGAVYAAEPAEEPVGKRVAELVKQLGHEDAEVRKEAVKALGRMRERARPAAPLLTRLALEDEEKYVRLNAAYSLRQIGAAEEAVPTFVEALAHAKSIERRAKAARAIGLLGPGAKPALPALVKALEDNSYGVRHTAAYALVWLREEAGPIEESIRGLDAESDKDKLRALRRLALMVEQIQPLRPQDQPKEALPSIIRLLDHEDRMIRGKAAFTLQFYGADAKAALPKLIEMISNENEEDGVIQTTLITLENVGPTEEARPAIVKLLDHPKSAIRVNASFALKRYGRKNEDALPKLIRLLERDPSVRVQENVAYILAEIGPAAKDAVPMLIKALHEEKWSKPGLAALALGKIGPAAKEAGPALRKLLAHEDGYVRVEAAGALVDIGADTKDVIPVLIKILGGKNSHNRRYAAEALGRIGPAAKEAVHTLKGLLTDRKPYVRKSAQEALEKIGPAEDEVF